MQKIFIISILLTASCVAPEASEPPTMVPELTCFTGDGNAYRGTVNVTLLGKACQMWSAQTPHEHNRTPEIYPSKGLEGNYCRNPDSAEGPWCYTTDSATRFEYCKVPRCRNQFENVATGKPTTLQSSESNHASDLALDGDPDTFTLSQVSRTPTWRVDLERVYRVDAVSITNRPDCCPEKLNGAQIHIGSSSSGNPRCAVVSAVPVGETYIYSCYGMEGRYVSIFIPGEGKQLALAEVQVFGKPADIPTPTPAPTTPTIPPPSPPPPLTLLVSGRTVVLVREELSWYDALFHCRSLYRDLASLRSPEEQLEVGEALLLRGAHTAHVWLGLRRRMLSSAWYWMNGEEMDHSSWEEGRPRYHEIPGTSACGAAANMAQFLWSDRPCKEQLNFLCYTDDDPDYSPVQFTITYART